MAYCTKSINVAAWDLMSRVGPKKTAEFAFIAALKATYLLLPSIALGTADIQLFEMLRKTRVSRQGFNTRQFLLQKESEDKKQQYHSN